MPLDSPRIPHPSGRSGPAVTHGYREVVGAFHVHSTYSDGQLPVEEIVRIANRQGLDFLILTDHNTLQPRRDGKEGWHGSTLVLVDTEISTQRGHFIALRTTEEIPARRDPQWTIDEVARVGGLGFIAHPFWNKIPWRDEEVRGFMGLEIYNAAHDIAEHHPLNLGFWIFLFGSDLTLSRWLDRSTEPLALWDRYLSRGDRVVGVGACDAHGLKRLGLHWCPYGNTFKLVRNHLLVEEDLTTEAIYEALERGHLFVAHDLVAEAKGFVFLAVAGGRVEGIMGDSVQGREGLRLYAHLPSAGAMVLFKDGREVARAQGQHGWFEASAAGVYRLEATRKGRPWIYSNPIYVIE